MNSETSFRSGSGGDDPRSYLELPSLVEALIFAAPEPVSQERLAEIIGDTTASAVVEAIGLLNEHYETTGRAFQIIRGGGGWRFATREQFGRWVKQLVLGSGHLRLSRAALETLSLIAYRQPISRAAIETVRGVDVGGVLKMLLERRMVHVTERGAGPGKPLLYATTIEFLKYFGLDSLADLPPIETFVKENAKAGQETGKTDESGSEVGQDDIN